MGAWNTCPLRFYSSASYTFHIMETKATYSEEVKSLEAKLNLALSNAPRERQAQVMANATVAAKKKDNREAFE